MKWTDNNYSYLEMVMESEIKSSEMSAQRKKDEDEKRSDNMQLAMQQEIAPAVGNLLAISEGVEDDENVEELDNASEVIFGDENELILQETI